MEGAVATKAAALTHLTAHPLSDPCTPDIEPAALQQHSSSSMRAAPAAPTSQEAPQQDTLANLASMDLSTTSRTDSLTSPSADADADADDDDEAAPPHEGSAQQQQQLGSSSFADVLASTLAQIELQAAQQGLLHHEHEEEGEPLPLLLQQRSGSGGGGGDACELEQSGSSGSSGSDGAAAGAGEADDAPPVKKVDAKHSALKALAGVSAIVSKSRWGGAARCCC